MESKIALVLFIFCIFVVTAEEDKELELLKRVKRVIGGDAIAEGQWPSLVHLEGKIPSKWSWWGTPYAYKNYYCTGSVLNRRWVMTAAHCFHVDGAPSGMRTPRYWHATVGEVNRAHNIVDRMWGWARGHPIFYKHVTEIHVYPSYSTSDNWKNDLALLKLEADLPLSSDKNMAAISLPTTDTTSWPKEGDVCVMKGWGCTQKGGTQPSVARAVKLPIQPESSCSYRYGYISSTRMCAGADAKNIGICQGDSGGPLVCKDNSGKWIQAGIASFTSRDAPSQSPGVFTRVSHYLNWIEGKVGRLGN